MLWLVFAIISLTSAGFMGIVHRYVMKEHDWLSYAFMTNILAAIFFIPLAMFNFVVPTENYAYVILFVGVGLWSLIAGVTMKSFQHIEASARAPLKQVQIIFLLIFSYIFLQEVLTFNKVVGSLLIFFAIILISYQKGRTFNKLTDIGTKLTLLAALLTASVSMIDKVALSFWNPAVYSFLVYLFPGIILGGFVTKRKEKFEKLIKSRLLLIIAIAVLEVVYYYTRLLAFNLTDVSNVFPILRLSVLVGVIGGIILLKERENISQKILSAIIMIIGAWLITV